MKPIQIILFVFLLGLFAAYFSIFRSKLFDRVIAVLFFLLGGTLVLSPGFANKIANALGVGRGADLMVYLGFVGGTFVFLVFYGKLRELKREVTALARHIALHDSKKPDEELRR